MYDTVNFRLNVMDVKTINISSNRDKLTDVMEVFKEDIEAYKTGNLGNLKLYWNNQIITVKGSLSKWFLEDNFQMLDYKGIALATEKLSDIFSLSFKKAEVIRLDLAGNLLMKFKPAAYYKYLVSSKYYKRLEQPKSIYFINKLRTKLFYDKIAELRKNRETTPSEFYGSNILRYELRYMKKIANEFNCPTINLEKLSDKDFYLSLINNWENEYKLVRKRREASYFDYAIIKTKKQLREYALLKYIEIEGGLDKIVQQLNEAKIRGDLSRKQLFDLKSEFYQSNDKSILAKKSEIIIELDEKIENFAKIQRESS